jgi:competence protein ComEA
MPSRNSNAYYYFTRKERRGALAVLSVILFFCFLPFFFPFFLTDSFNETNKFDSALASLKTRNSLEKRKNFPKRSDGAFEPYYKPSSQTYSNVKKADPFYFDPNTISGEGWKKLGLRDKTISTILNYRSKGGKFSSPGDLKKIWGIFPDEADRLIPFVQIAKSIEANAAINGNYREYPQSTATPIRPVKMVQINEADSTELIGLPGIGPKLSQRIINFRSKLGGFYAIEQVSEIYGLTDSVFQKIRPKLLISGPVKKININTALFEDLHKHPYIKFDLAKAFLLYRQQHGNFSKVEDIKKIMLVDEDLFRKLSPYISIQE